MRVIRLAPAFAPAMFALLSCTDPAEPRTPTSVSIVGGGGQAATVTSALPEPIIVEVRDASGRAVRGAAVAWTIATGGGSISEPTTRTDGSGQAQVTWTLGVSSGENRLRAIVTGIAPVIIAATAQAGAPATITMASGDRQLGMTSIELGDAIAVRVRDAHGNAVSGATVEFTANQGAVSASTALTNSGGVATTRWILGPESGEQSVDARVQGIATTLRFTATARSADEIDVLENDVPVEDITATSGTDLYYRIRVPPGAMRLVVTATGVLGDADIFVRYGALPTFSTFNCRGVSPFSIETCTIEAPAAGDWFILVTAYQSYSELTLRATHITAGSIALTVDGLPPGVNAGITIIDNGQYSTTATGSRTITGLVPGTYTLTSDNIIHQSTVYNATPAAVQLAVTPGDTTEVSVTYTASSGLNLDVSRIYITQGVQRPTGTVPLIAGRDGLLRVFARSNDVNSLRPAVRVRIYHNNALVDTRTIETPGNSVPVVHDDGVLESTYNLLLPGSLIQPGMGVLVDIDTDNDVEETDETDNTYPASGTPLMPQVRTAHVFRARLVPVRQANDSTGDVTASNLSSYITTARALYPLPDIDADVRAPYMFSGVLPGAYTAEWARLLNEIGVLRLTDGSTRYYYGVIKPGYVSGGTGLGYLSYPAAIGVDWSHWRAETIAHEWGHNFGRLHVACGGASSTDLRYPYTNRPGALGHHGYDIRTNTIRSKDTHQDLMSYCQPTWASDYTYEAVMAYRAAEPDPVSDAVQPSLLVWGRISPDGAVLEPSFEVRMPAAPPPRSGKYRVTGTHADGSTVLDFAFDGIEIDHMPGHVHFAFAIPLGALGGRMPAELRLSGVPGGTVRQQAGVADATDVRVTRADAGRVRVQWDAERHPVLMVRDPRSGEILSLARGGDVRLATDANEIEINVSDGVRSTARRFAVTQ